MPLNCKHPGFSDFIDKDLNKSAGHVIDRQVDMGSFGNAELNGRNRIKRIRIILGQTEYAGDALFFNMSVWLDSDASINRLSPLSLPDESTAETP